MESENGVTLEDDSCVIEKNYVEESVVDLKKEGDNVGKGEVPTMNGISEPANKAEGFNSSEVVVKTSATVARSKNPKSVKEPSILNFGSPKNNKLAKDKANLKTTTPFSRNQRSILTQSLSLPARVRADGINKSIDVYPLKREAKDAQRNRTKSQASSGPVTSTSRLNHPNRPATTGLHTKEANTIGGASGPPASLGSTPSIRRSLLGTSGSLKATSNCPAEASLSVNQNLNPMKTALPVKEDDDARSATSSVTPHELRSSASRFSFRLEERAEKRKEFFSKLEEKIQAREEERTNLQAKSKENQEAEIKQLRKSLTFKATPMPSFYKEPPPRTEIKKIPTTRPISPKLGRTVKTNSSEGDAPCVSPHPTLSPKLMKSKNSITANNSSEGRQNNSTKGFRAESNKNVVASKKLIRKSQPGLQSQEVAVTKTERPPTKPKPEASGEETQSQKACKGENEESQKQSPSLSEYKDEIDLEPTMETAQNDATVLNSPTPEIMPHEVTVGG